MSTGVERAMQILVFILGIMLMLATLWIAGKL